MKRTILFMALLVTASIAGAATITPENPENVTLNPGEEYIQEFDVSLDNNDTEVRAISTNSGNYDVSYKSFRIFDKDDKFRAQIQAPSEGNYSDNVTFEFNVKRENKSDTTITRSVDTTTRVAYNMLEESVWINESYQLDMNGELFNVSRIATNLYLNDNEEKIEDSEVFNDVRLTVEETIPGEYAKITADSKSDSATFSKKVITETKEVEPQCKLGIRTITTLQRGNGFAIETIDQNSDDNSIIGGASITLIDSGVGEPIGNTESGSSGYASVFVPEDTKGPVIARVTKADSECTSNNQEVNFNKPYNVYIEGNEKFQLDMNIPNTTVYGDIKGVVTNQRGSEVGTGIVRVEKPNGQTTDLAFNETGFSYSPNNPGEYKLTSTKDGYVDSSTETVTYIADRDGDGIPNSEDKCPDTEGVEANNGCERKEGFFTAYQDGERYTGVLRPGTEYTFQVEDRNGSKLDYSGEIDIEGTDQTIQFKDGVAPTDGQEAITFDNEGTYTLALEGVDSAYENMSSNYRVEKDSVFNDLTVMPIIVVILILGVGLAIMAAYSGGGKSTTTTNDGEYGYNLDNLGKGEN